MSTVSYIRTWAEWRAHFEKIGLLRPMPTQARSERAASVSPLISLDVLDEYEFWAEWDPNLEMFVARCEQLPHVWWPHPDSEDAAVLAWAMCLESFIVGLNSDLCLVPGMATKSDAAEQQWHLNARHARESFLDTLGGSSEGKEA